MGFIILFYNRWGKTFPKKIPLPDKDVEGRHNYVLIIMLITKKLVELYNVFILVVVEIN